MVVKCLTDLVLVAQIQELDFEVKRRPRYSLVSIIIFTNLLDNMLNTSLQHSSTGVYSLCRVERGFGRREGRREGRERFGISNTNKLKTTTRSCDCTFVCAC